MKLRLGRLADHAILVAASAYTGFTLANGNIEAAFLGIVGVFAAYRYIEVQYHTLLLDKPE